jgi:hypothetical protein
MEHPIKFISRRRPNTLKFKINPGKAGVFLKLWLEDIVSLEWMNVGINILWSLCNDVNMGYDEIQI